MRTVGNLYYTTVRIIGNLCYTALVRTLHHHNYNIGNIIGNLCCTPHHVKSWKVKLFVKATEHCTPGQIWGNICLIIGSLCYITLARSASMSAVLFVGKLKKSKLLSRSIFYGAYRGVITTISIVSSSMQYYKIIYCIHKLYLYWYLFVFVWG